MHQFRADPYVYPDSSVLINKFDLRNSDALAVVEVHCFIDRCSQGIPHGNLDYTHLKAIHHHKP